jgi:cellulose synthase/poly-beta-1,6-N-acetylglucosamine synthase-like glycosyltransferase
MSFISFGLALIAAVLSVPVVVFFVEVVAALGAATVVDGLPLKTKKYVAVIVPAHDESVGIIQTIGDIKPQLGEGDRLIVVADNCTDDTASVSSEAGAVVLVRDDLENIGKGYALGWGIDHIAMDPPDFVLFIDADCRIQSDAVERLKEACDVSQRPVQACFLMKSPENSPIDHRFAEFAFLLRNKVRPLGLKNLNGPVQLMGTGMIFPWRVISKAPLASGHLVEDLKLGLDLAAIGSAPHFFPSVTVTSDFPVTSKGTDSQRQRWVQGHIGMILKTVPQLLIRSIALRSLDLALLSLDLLVPPLSLLGILIASMFISASLAAAFGASYTCLLLAGANLILFCLAVVLAWARFGRDILPGKALWSIGPLLLKRLRLYGRIFAGRTVTQWIRTERRVP